MPAELTVLWFITTRREFTVSLLSSMPSSVANQWISRPEPRSLAPSRLFCFPYAGGGAPIFRSWPKGIPQSTEVCAVQLPGRGPRIRETPFSRMKPLVSALTDALLPLFDKPFAFFGHSMGAWLSFEVARLLRTKHEIEPTHLFVSGAWGPHVQSREAPIHNLSETKFIEALGALNGTPREVFESPELMRLVLPILRADFAVCETYKYTSGTALSCPITVFGGLQDERLRPSDLKAWRHQTTGIFSLRMFPGDHFFLKGAEKQLLRSLAAELKQTVSG